MNRWECDENDHMNVRFFLQKHWETLAAGNSSMAHDQEDILDAIRIHHLRFHQEARLATPLSGYFSVLPQSDGHLRLLTELRQSFTQEVLSTSIHELDMPDSGLPAGIASRTLDAHAAPRGVQSGTSKFTQVEYDDLQTRGFALIGTGRIDGSECDSNGRLMPYRYMGRLSDSMPHLWGAVHEKGVLDENEGGAVLEYRLEYFKGLRADDCYEIWSGLHGVGTKLQEFIHLVFNGSHELAMAAEAVGVRLDLNARKSKVLSPGVIEQMRKKVVDSSGLAELQN